MEFLGPLGSSIAGGKMTFTQCQAGPSSCGKCKDYIHVLSQTYAFLPCCWLLGGPEALTRHVGCAKLGIPSGVLAPVSLHWMKLAWNDYACSGCFPMGAFQCSSTAAPGYKQCCGSWRRLESQLSPALRWQHRPAQKVCEEVQMLPFLSKRNDIFFSKT